MIQKNKFILFIYSGTTKTYVQLQVVGSLFELYLNGELVKTEQYAAKRSFTFVSRTRVDTVAVYAKVINEGTHAVSILTDSLFLF